MQNITILDSSSQVFFARQLEHVKAKSYDVQHADLVARQLFPVTGEAGPAVDTITYTTYDMVGSARIISHYADDLPRADVYGRETTIPVRSVGTSFGYNRNEILQAQLVGSPLDQRRANAAQRAWEEVVDDIAWNGSAKDGLIGILTHPNIPTFASTTAGGWLADTPDNIIADCNALVAQMAVSTKMKETPDTLLLPIAEYNHINGTPRASNSDTTIMQFILQNVEGISIIKKVNELTGSGLLYANNNDKLELEIPKELEFLPPQERGLELLVPAWGKTAGVNIYYPLSLLKISGI